MDEIKVSVQVQSSIEILVSLDSGIEVSVSLAGPAGLSVTGWLDNGPPYTNSLINI